MTTEQKDEILRLKREGKGYKTISRLTGININTVKTTCRRSGLFRDNPEHEVLFTIPERKYSTAVGMTKPLPPQRTITGHKQTDAYLWILDVIKTGEPSHIESAEEALKKLTISPKQAQERYTHYLQSQGAGWTSVFSTLWMDDPQHYINIAKEQLKSVGDVRGIFGSLDAAFDPVGAEHLIEAKYGPCQDIYCDIMSEKRNKYTFTDVLPEPFTLSDAVREILYWDWLASMRASAHKELYPDEYTLEQSHLWDREEYLVMLLEKIKPISRTEAFEVLKWYLEYPRYQDLGADKDGVYLNLIGMHEAA